MKSRRNTENSGDSTLATLVLLEPLGRATPGTAKAKRCAPTIVPCVS